MSFLPVLDIEALCAPVSDANPAGEFFDSKSAGDPVGSIEYGAFRKMSRWEEERVEQQWGRIDYAPDPGSENWDNVIRSCHDLLLKSKDLRLLKMLVVAAAYKYGIAGIRDGFRLVTAMVRQYPTSLHPQPYPKAIERLPAIPNVLAAALKVAPWTMPEAEKAVTPEHWTVSEYLAGNRDKLLPEQLQRFDRTAISLSEINKLLLSSSREFRRDLLQTLDEAAEAAEELRAAIKDVVKKQGDFEKFKVQLSTFQSFSEVVGSAAMKQFRSLLTSENSEISQGTSALEPPSRHHLSGRQEALMAVESARRYFSEAEPHSPLSAMLARVIGWAGLSFDDLMKEMLGDQPTALNALKDRANFSVGDKSKLAAPPPPPSEQAPTKESSTKSMPNFG